ncbi:probable ADP-ribosylation factor GTPase-activating protein AGD14 isoform X1 [Coffea arabica]|uniref:Probable ADP-ribosylation factor GTPase-activating protein AGD14 isoform X1 n=2 Tax=Coffea arabica TaxID=13443 RepID=A0A6P6SYE8_COFAR|nr:probable ADP-ribosylation factor GTPase-activating protein AGD14 isoform X1 [Coffea arabica]
MSSRKEEERNEKIIRGLMKLPPNRRCINCNSLGPQYVCTNFWTFVCMTCSGIHREFTHRVKSVSMAKFTFQEVEALQNGGNQRAREVYLKHWDSQRQRLPDNSNAEKVREFIRNVYVMKKYVGGGSFDRPPRDSQIARSHEDETRRASSYHSYSQSPPYDFQYEERQYGRHAPVLTRKPGSDRGLYEGKVSSFLSPSRLSDRSPSRLSDHIYEDRFGFGRSNSRVSDYSSSAQSPNFQKDIGSPSSETSREFCGEDIAHNAANRYPDSYANRGSGQMLYPQRTASSESIGSLDSNSLSFKTSVGVADVGSEAEQSVEARSKKIPTLTSLPQTSAQGNHDSLDLFTAPFALQNVTSIALAVSTSNLPGLSSTQSIDPFGTSCLSTASNIDMQQLPKPNQSSSMDLFSEIPQQPPAASLDDKSLKVIPQNEGWATFDTPQHSAPVGNVNSAVLEVPSDKNPGQSFNPLLSLNQWPSFENNSSNGPSSSMPPWGAAWQIVEAKPRIEPWNAFEESYGQLVKRSSEQVVNQSSFAEQYLYRESEGFNNGEIPTVGRDTLPPIATVSSEMSLSQHQHDAPIPPVMGGHSHALGPKSTNPFDLPYDAKIESENMSNFWDVSSLQAALPNGQMSTPFTAGANEHWFAQEPMVSYVPAGSDGALGFLVGQAPSTQMSNVPSHGPVASVGGNPFA